MKRSREITEIIADVVRKTAEGCVLAVNGTEIPCPEINYTFGNAQYIKDRLDELSREPRTADMKYPLIALSCPFTEQRNTNDFYTKAKVRVLIATSSDREWSNEQRQVFSFRDVLRPIYKRFIEALREDGRLDFGYDDLVAHDYSENYSYGRYGAYTPSGEAVSDPIDAININNLDLTVKNPNCRQR